MPNYKNGKIISYAGMGISTAATYATTYLYPATSILLNSIIAFFAMLYSIMKNQESVQMIQSDAESAHERLKKLEQEDLRGIPAHKVIALLNQQTAQGKQGGHNKDISLDLFLGYQSDARKWSAWNRRTQLLGFLMAQGIYQAANDESDHDQSLHQFWNWRIVPLLMCLQMFVHMYCAHRINQPKDDSRGLRERIHERSYLYSNPNIRLAVLLREEQAIRGLVAEASKYTQIYDDIIFPMTEEIKKLTATEDRVDQQIKELLNECDTLKDSLALIMPKIEEDMVTLAETRPASVFANR